MSAVPSHVALEKDLAATAKVSTVKRLAINFLPPISETSKPRVTVDVQWQPSNTTQSKVQSVLLWSSLALKNGFCPSVDVS